MAAEGGKAIVGECWDSGPFLDWRSGRSSQRMMSEAIEAIHTIIAMLQRTLILAMRRKLGRILHLVYVNHGARPAKAALPTVLTEFTSSQALAVRPSRLELCTWINLHTSSILNIVWNRKRSYRDDRIENVCQCKSDVRAAQSRCSVASPHRYPDAQEDAKGQDTEACRI